MKKVIVFDLDGTLTASKQPITGEMADLLSRLLETHQVCVISGGEYERFQVQLLDRFKVESTNYQNVYLMPTNGTSFYRFEHGGWTEVYREELPETARSEIVAALTQGAKDLGIWEEKTWGNVVADRGTQVTFSGLGQGAPLEAKLKWDTDRAKREKLRALIKEKLPMYETNIAGETSLDVTKKGIDKAYGMRRLQEALSVKPEDILFIGDALEEGGNDYPVKAAGIETVAVKDEQECAEVIRGLLDTPRRD